MIGSAFVYRCVTHGNSSKKNCNSFSVVGRQDVNVAARAAMPPHTGGSLSSIPVVETTARGMFTRVQVVTLEDGLLPIPHNFSVAIEVGVSDRDTLDNELLPARADLFLVSLEPLVDKYARGLARNRNGKGDAPQPLGHHGRFPDRSLILPVAVSDVGPQPSVARFNVGRDNAGCSSLLKLNRRSDRLQWCARTGEHREVPVISLRHVLSMVPSRNRVALVKVDAQGVDLSVMRSAGDALQRVERFTLEVISDDCAGIYEGQPNCSTVLAATRAWGYVPSTPVYCTPRIPASARARWRKTAWGCELGVVFARQDLVAQPYPRELLGYHFLAQNGCHGTTPTSAEAPDGAIVMIGPHRFIRASRDATSTPAAKTVPNVVEPYLCSVENA